MFSSKFISSALLLLTVTQAAVAIVCGNPPLPACPSFPPCAHPPSFAATPWAASASKRADFVPELGRVTKLGERQNEVEVDTAKYRSRSVLILRRQPLYCC
ncbi:hypothetical protein C8F04DRAFT_1232691 [Mycena alexandri]|uniref:Uncharacterized protein n=1 Tax=Mycena alexandri TaxID=1745969 RepID=A0AAD6X361_9AGAR|nr:hypothetical protein C8F04DRAFT_1232691 [Mycena alexandri]